MKTKICFLLLCILALVPYVTASNQTKLSIVSDGDIVQIVVSDVSDLYGFEFKLSFDASVFAVERIEFSGLSEPSRIFYYELGVDYVHVAVCSLYPNLKGVDGNIVLATIHFASEASGTSPLSFEMSILADSNANAIPHKTENGLITIKEIFTHGISLEERRADLW